MTDELERRRKKRCHMCNELLSQLRGYWTKWSGGAKARHYCARCYLIAIRQEQEEALDRHLATVREDQESRLRLVRDEDDGEG